MTTLNEQEREALGRALTTVDTVTIVDPGGPLATAVEAILTARLAKVEALADEWERLTDDGLLHYANRYVADLRAALASDPTHTPNGTQA